MNTISIKEAKKIKLMNRIDKKYIINFEQFCSLTNWIVDNYYIVVDEDNNFLLDYCSLYWDTIYDNMFLDHENKVKNRQKIRIREYSNGEKYIEIKTKPADDKTKKIRIPFKDCLDDSKKWIEKHLYYDYYSLGQKLEVKFKRLTLVSPEKNSRITIDFGIKFYNYETKISSSIKDIIVEVKKETEELSKFEQKLNELGIEEHGFSKFYIGINKTREAN